MENAIRRYAAQRLEAVRPRLFQMGLSDDEIKAIELRIAAKADGEPQSVLSIHEADLE